MQNNFTCMYINVLPAVAVHIRKICEDVYLQGDYGCGADHKHSGYSRWVNITESISSLCASSPLPVALVYSGDTDDTECSDDCETSFECAFDNDRDSEKCRMLLEKYSCNIFCIGTGKNLLSSITAAVIHQDAYAQIHSQKVQDAYAQIHSQKVQDAYAQIHSQKV